jgi:hypothetical protein
MSPEPRFVLVVGIFFLLQWLLFCLVCINDPLEGQFLWLIVLSVSPLLFVVRLNRLADAIFIFAVAATFTNMQRSVKWTVMLHRTADNQHVVGAAAHLSREPKPGELLVKDGITFVGPPRFSWEKVAGFGHWSLAR